jgi:hypothetical protein
MYLELFKVNNAQEFLDKLQVCLTVGIIRPLPQLKVNEIGFIVTNLQPKQQAGVAFSGKFLLIVIASLLLDKRKRCVDKGLSGYSKSLI